MMVGFGIGGVPVAYALFMEFVPASGRGLWLVVIEVFWTIGTLFESGIAWAVLPGAGWRWFLGISTIPLILLMALFPFLPESPRYLSTKGDAENALKVLKRVAKVNGKTLPIGTLQVSFPKQAEDEIDSSKIPQLGCAGLVNKTLDVSNSLVSSFRKLFSRTLLLTSVLLIVVWFTNALAYYGLVLLATELHTQDKDEQECDLDDPRKPSLSSGDYNEIFVTASAEMPGLIFAALLVDFIGRKRTMSISLVLTALFIAPLLSGNTSVVLFFFSRAFVMASFTIIYIYTPEVYPTYVRTFGLGFFTSLSRIGGLVAPFVSVDLAGNGHAKAAEGILMTLCFISSVFTCLLPIETKGRHLRDTGEIEMVQVTLGGGEVENNNDEALGNIRNQQLEIRVPFQREDPISHI
eukprot:TRINITY_DN4381_c0_g1_i1.p1 TRINITY_DN4381_c0_g1~~TRINITY_DN4381_c0_g1_i1.p1  ORF type:complete len:407 (-),score=57.81 TRINITY_DN4381_c0_g1_i1:195-1415(-)